MSVFTDLSNIDISPEMLKYAKNYLLLRHMNNMFNRMDGYSLKELVQEGKTKMVYVKYRGKCTCEQGKPYVCNDKWDTCTNAGCDRHLEFDIQPYCTELNYTS